MKIKSDDDGIFLASKIAELSLFHIRVGAVAIDKRGRVLSAATNVIKTHPVQAAFAKRMGQENRVHLHAEINALLRAKEVPHKLFVARIGKRGQLLPGCPCPICQEYIKVNYQLLQLIHS